MSPWIQQRDSYPLAEAWRPPQDVLPWSSIAVESKFKLQNEPRKEFLRTARGHRALHSGALGVRPAAARAGQAAERGARASWHILLTILNSMRKHRRRWDPTPAQTSELSGWHWRQSLSSNAPVMDKEIP